MRAALTFISPRRLRGTATIGLRKVWSYRHRRYHVSLLARSCISHELPVQAALSSHYRIVYIVIVALASYRILSLAFSTVPDLQLRSRILQA